MAVGPLGVSGSSRRSSLDRAPPVVTRRPSLVGHGPDGRPGETRAPRGDGRPDDHRQDGRLSTVDVRERTGVEPARRARADGVARIGEPRASHVGVGRAQPRAPGVPESRAGIPRRPRHQRDMATAPASGQWSVDRWPGAGRVEIPTLSTERRLHNTYYAYVIESAHAAEGSTLPASSWSVTRLGRRLPSLPPALPGGRGRSDDVRSVPGFGRA